MEEHWWIESSFETKLEIIARLSRRKESDALIELLIVPSPAVRVEIIRALAAFDEKNILDLLMWRLGDPAPEVRREVAIPLKKFRKNEVIEHLIFHLNNRERNSTVSIEILNSLGHLKSARAFKTLLEWLSQYTSHAVSHAAGARAAAATAIADFGDIRAVNPLLDMIVDMWESINVSYHRYPVDAIITLLEAKPLEVLPLLEAFITQKKRWIQENINEQPVVFKNEEYHFDMIYLLEKARSIIGKDPELQRKYHEFRILISKRLINR